MDRSEASEPEADNENSHPLDSSGGFRHEVTAIRRAAILLTISSHEPRSI